MSTEPHIADAEDEFFVLSVTPDMCQVGKSVVAFEPMQRLSSEQGNYSSTVFSRDEKILLINSVIHGMKGNAGTGLASGVAVQSGNAIVKEGSQTVFIEDRMTARDGDEVDMNVSAG
jgi:hypothetical protein